MAEHTDNKTEAPTPRRRESAREEGQVVFSSDFTSAILMLAVALLCWLAGARWIEYAGGAIHQQISNLRRTEWGHAQTLLSIRWVAVHLLVLAGTLVGGIWVLNALTSLVQAGVGFHTKALAPDPERLSPEKGWQKIFSLDNLFTSVFAPFKLIISLTVAVTFFYVFRDRISLSTHGSLQQTMRFCGELSCLLLLTLAAVFLVMGAADFLFKWLRHEKKLMMSRDELKREFRDTEGDAEAKIRRMKLKKNAQNQKSLEAVPKADAVITNPTHFAVAVRYDTSKPSSAPVVVARGTDQFARRIIAVAKEHGVLVVERRPLARALYALTEVGQEIPAELYMAVAEILAVAYRRKSAA